MAPKTLTRAEFQRVKPGGKYSKYLAYIAKHRPPVDPLMEKAKALAAASLDPVRAEYDRAAKQRMADAIAASNAAKGFASAFGRANAEIPTTSGAAYQAAAQALAGSAYGLEGRGKEITDAAARAAMEDVARLSGAKIEIPSAAGALSMPREMAIIDAATNVGRAPLVTRALNALDTASRLKLADWADIQRHKGVQEASDIREKFLAEAAKRPGLIQQAYLSLQKDSREAQQLELLKDQMELKRLDTLRKVADSKAARAQAQKEYERKLAETNAKIAGEGTWDPNTTDKKAKEWQKNRAKRLEIISDIRADAGAVAKKFYLDSHGRRAKPNMTRSFIRKHLIAIYWPKLRAAKAGGQARQDMLSAIDALIDELIAAYPLPGTRAGGATVVVPPTP